MKIEDTDLEDSTNYGWGAEIGVLLRHEALLTKTEVIKTAIYFEKIAPWIIDKERSWDLLDCNDPEDDDVPDLGSGIWTQMLYMLNHHFGDFPEFITALITDAVTDLCLEVAPHKGSLQDTENEFAHTHRHFNSNEVFEGAFEKADSINAPTGAERILNLNVEQDL